MKSELLFDGMAKIFLLLLFILWLQQHSAECKTLNAICLIVEPIQILNEYCQMGDLIIGAFTTQYNCVFETSSFNESFKMKPLCDLVYGYFFFFKLKTQIDKNEYFCSFQWNIQQTISVLFYIMRWINEVYIKLIVNLNFDTIHFSFISDIFLSILSC